MRSKPKWKPGGDRRTIRVQLALDDCIINGVWTLFCRLSENNLRKRIAPYINLCVNKYTFNRQPVKVSIRTIMNDSQICLARKLYI